jgi:hypothetical protein
MVGEPRDKTAYSLAIAGLGLSLLAVVIGVCWIAARHGDPAQVVVHHCDLHLVTHCKLGVDLTAATDPPKVSDDLWGVLVGLATVLIGVLIPFPFPLSPRRFESPGRPLDPPAWFAASLIATVAVFAAVALLVSTASSDRSLLSLAFGGLLLGLLIPSPARRD